MSKQQFLFLTAVFYFVGNSEMVLAMLEAGCDKNAKMGIPATIQLTPKWQPIKLIIGLFACRLSLFTSFSLQNCFEFLYLLTSQRGIINMQTKEKFIY